MLGLSKVVAALVLLLSLAPGFAIEPSSPCAESVPDTIAIIGAVRDLRDGRLLYCEWHGKHDTTDTSQVFYRDVDGTLFAEKQLAWHHGASTPAFVQRDFRSGEDIRVAFDGGGWLMSYQKQADARVQQTRLAVDAVDVIDAGFDHYVRTHWTALVAGESVSANFASPVLRRSLPLRIRQRETSACPPSRGDYCFWVEAGNPVIRWFVEPLRLSYDAHRRLVSFEGVVNVRDSAGVALSARIEYIYVTQK